ncbi:hypothetical protein YC2023_113813 [Brassica napus]
MHERTQRGRVEVKRGEVLLREVEATKAPSSPAQVSGRWLASSATSPRFCLRGRVLKAEEKWLRWRLTGFELRRNEGVGGGAQAVSRVGDGQAEASVDAWRADDEISTRVPAP